ncbi:MAG: hypothetical protein EO766_12105 [Hydrotalea sp. AMD]|uniref:hypothetical protein n=1 Tax=Hydrotalea sp. AMD TaxID=2501297 RepID=UPI00102702CB|nr:hypothetical protein [Hydrotalea sp. AMD]RWZ87261.1 MAG: hypothetical protein EO766_12105 [Hydrotalea sp. AMD]
MDLEQIKKIAGITESAKPKSKGPDVLSESMRRIAGLPMLVEREEDDDYEDDSGDEDEDVKKAESESKKKGVSKPFWEVNKLKSDKKPAPTPKKEVEKKEEEDDDEDDETDEEYNARMKRRSEKLGTPYTPKDSSKKAEKSEPKKAEASTEAKRRGKAPNPSSKSGVLRQWIIDHPGVTRAEAWKHAVSVFGEKSEENTTGITKAGFSTLYQNARDYHKLGKKFQTKESWVIMHPSVNGYILHENREMNQFQWVSYLSDNQDPMVFESEEEANEVAQYLRDFRNQNVVVEHVVFDDEDDNDND